MLDDILLYTWHGGRCQCRDAWRGDWPEQASCGLFWPIASMADFFGQWNNIFMWSAIAIALAGARIASEDDTAPKG